MELKGQLVLNQSLSLPFQGQASVKKPLNKEREEGYEINTNGNQSSVQQQQYSADWHNYNQQQNIMQLQRDSNSQSKDSPKLKHLIMLEKGDSDQLKNNDQTKSTIECGQVQIQMPMEQPADSNINNQIDFSDPKNRQMLEDQFFGKSEAVSKAPNSNLKADSKFNQRKFKFLAIFLALGGIALIIIGFIVSFSGSETNIMRGGAFWVVGCLCCIPGVYYSYKIIRAYQASKTGDSSAKDIPRF